LIYQNKIHRDGIEELAAIIMSHVNMDSIYRMLEEQ